MNHPSISPSPQKRWIRAFEQVQVFKFLLRDLKWSSQRTSPGSNNIWNLYQCFECLLELAWSARCAGLYILGLFHWLICTRQRQSYLKILFNLILLFEPMSAENFSISSVLSLWTSSEWFRSSPGLIDAKVSRIWKAINYVSNRHYPRGGWNGLWRMCSIWALAAFYPGCRGEGQCTQSMEKRSESRPIRELKLNDGCAVRPSMRKGASAHK